MASQLIQQVRVIDPATAMDQVTDVRVVDGQITAIGSSPAQEEDALIDGQGKVLLPGLIDLYSHSGEPGNESRETLESLLRAGRAGGFTRLGVLPTTTPAIDSAAMVADLQYRRNALAHSQTLPQISIWGALTHAAQGESLTELAELAAAGIVGFTDSRPLQNPLLLRRVLEYAQPLNKPLAFWPCDRTLVGQGVAREGDHSLIYGLPGDPALSETTALATLLECVAAAGTPVHVMRLSTARGVALISQAKAAGLPVTASTTWMHLLCSAADLKTYNANLRIAPPLGNPADQAALIEAVGDGRINAIAIDHRPYTYEEKTVGFPSAPPGVIGLELALPLLWQTFVATNRWSATTLVQRLSSGPAACLGQQPPQLQPNQSAEMILFDPQAAWEVSSTTLHSRSSNTPWLGQTLQGRVLEMWTG
ncbi:dihydroorotase [Pseudanabaena sp. FACHB-2040]|uniref:dihydroorotase n=1 Tax=Pseudanabaena sp. FACHB-2040 TaxID=2692859 RepID=UPI001683E07E|nr:dihydroorotase [Pseudanabaena sp. FACHB-2040]MBD2259936.1 dihydroorotase [Pseudanabaena sp. FACHB-2040]